MRNLLCTASVFTVFLALIAWSFCIYVSGDVWWTAPFISSPITLAAWIALNVAAPILMAAGVVACVAFLWGAASAICEALGITDDAF